MILVPGIYLNNALTTDGSDLGELIVAALAGLGGALIGGLALLIANWLALKNERRKLVLQENLRAYQAFISAIASIQADPDRHPAEIYRRLLIEYNRTYPYLDKSVKTECQKVLDSEEAQRVVVEMNSPGCTPGSELARDLQQRLHKAFNPVLMATRQYLDGLRERGEL